MRKYVIKVSVEEDKVRKAAGDNDLKNAILTEAGWMQESGILAESVEEVSEEKSPRKYILITVDIAITSKEFPSAQAAHDEMLKQILDQSNYNSEEKLMDAVNAGDAWYSDNEAVVPYGDSSTIAWKIIAA